MTMVIGRQGTSIHVILELGERLAGIRKMEKIPDQDGHDMGSNAAQKVQSGISYVADGSVVVSRRVVILQGSLKILWSLSLRVCVVKGDGEKCDSAREVI